MSDYTGPGVYEFIPAHAPSKQMNVWGGGETSGTAVKLYDITQAENALWEIVAAGGAKGNPEVGDREYHIVAVNSGLMLCAPADGSKSYCTVSTRSVRHGSTRWKIVPANNGYHFFVSALDSDRWLAVEGAKDENGAPLMVWNKEQNKHFQFKLKRPTW